MDRSRYTSSASLRAYQPAKRRFPFTLQLSRQVRIIASLIAILILTLTATFLYIAGPLDPSPHVSTLVSLPAPLFPATYSQLASDKTGWLWVAQSAPGLASNPHDTILLTVVDPDSFFGPSVKAHLCIVCDSSTGIGNVPALQHIDSVSADPLRPHSIYVSGWTQATPSLPVVLRVELPTDISTCNNKPACAIVTPILTVGSDVALVKDKPPAHLLQDLLGLNVHPLLSLATTSNGTLYTFLSDRGRPSLADVSTNILGGFQGLISYSDSSASWREVYVGPSGTYDQQQTSPTSTVTAITIAADRYLYLADSDHAAIYMVDLQNPLISSPTTFIAASAFKKYAGAAQLVQGNGVDSSQSVPALQISPKAKTAFPLGVISSLVVDENGTLLASDTTNARLNGITPTSVSVVAGNGTATFAGDGNAPSEMGLRGILGIATGSHRRVFLVQGGAVDDSGQIRVRVINWAWSSAQGSQYNVASAGQGSAADSIAGGSLPSQKNIIASIVTGGHCVDRQNSNGCVSPYVVATGGWGSGQLTLSGPGPYLERDPLTNALLGGTTPLSIDHTPVQVLGGGLPETIVANQGGTITFAAPYGGCCGATTPTPKISVPNGTVITGIATLFPTTDAQAHQSGGAYLVVAAHTDAGSAELIIYKGSADTCGVNQNFPSNCSLPGAMSNVATLSLPGIADIGAVTSILSNDGSHAFALVASPQANNVNAIDLTSILNGATTVPTPVAIPINHPTTLVIRHDGLVAYAGTANGQIATINTTEWLQSGISTTIPTPQQLPLSGGASVMSLALSGDDSHLMAGLVAASGTSLVAQVSIGKFGMPTAPALVSSTSVDAHLIAIALTPGDDRLLTLAAPEGPSKPGLLRTWLTHSQTQLSQWLEAPIRLTGTPTPADPRGIGTIRVRIG